MAKDYTKLMNAPYAILTQFQRDFSFENPGVMTFLVGEIKEEPQHSMDWNLGFNKIQEHDYEVMMKMTLVAKSGEETLYMIEVHYGAIVRVNEKNKDMTQPILSAEVPAHLYPFIRAIVARAVADGGYPPVLLPPIDFHGHFVQRMQELEAAQGKEGKMESGDAGKKEIKKAAAGKDAAKPKRAKELN